MTKSAQSTWSMLVSCFLPLKCHLCVSSCSHILRVIAFQVNDPCSLAWCACLFLTANSWRTFVRSGDWWLPQRQRIGRATLCHFHGLLSCHTPAITQTISWTHIRVKRIKNEWLQLNFHRLANLVIFFATSSPWGTICQQGKRWCISGPPSCSH